MGIAEADSLKRPRQGASTFLLCKTQVGVERLKRPAVGEELWLNRPDRRVNVFGVQKIGPQEFRNVEGLPFGRKGKVQTVGTDAAMMQVCEKTHSRERERHIKRNLVGIGKAL